MLSGSTSSSVFTRGDRTVVQYHSRPHVGGSPPLSLFVNRQKKGKETSAKNEERKEEKQTKIMRKILEELKMIVEPLIAVYIIHNIGAE